MYIKMKLKKLRDILIYEDDIIFMDKNNNILNDNIILKTNMYLEYIILDEYE